MLFGSQQNIRAIGHLSVKLRDHVLVPCLEANNLGLIFGRTVTWNSLVLLVSKRCFGILTGRSHLKHCLPASVLLALVNALVLSQVRYCLSVYENESHLNLSRIQKVLNFAAKLIFGRKKHDNASDLHRRLGWLSAEDQGSFHIITIIHKIRSHITTLIHKILRSGEPDSLACVLRTVGDVHSRPTRQDDDLFVPHSRTEVGKRRFYSCMYNLLPIGLRQLPIGSFRRQLRRYLVGRRAGSGELSVGSCEHTFWMGVRASMWLVFTILTIFLLTMGRNSLEFIRDCQIYVNWTEPNKRVQM